MKNFFTKLLTTLFLNILLLPSNVHAFSKLTNGFENITRTYLIPLSGAVAGATFILFVTLSYFKQEKYIEKVGNVLVLSIFTGCGLELVTNMIQSFS